MRRVLVGLLSLFVLAGCQLPTPRGSEAEKSFQSLVEANQALAQDSVVVPPTEISVPTIGASSTLVATGLNPDGTAEVVPTDQPMQASYLDWSDDIEMERPLVVYAHINGRVDGRSVPGLFARLSEIEQGDEVTVTRADGTVDTYVIESVEQVDKDAFPTRRVYDIAPGMQIRLVTCEGDFDSATGHYEDNFIAYGRVIA